MKVLVVDDDKAMRTRLEFLFKREGHEVLLAANQNGALDLVRGLAASKPIDVALIDYLFYNEALDQQEPCGVDVVRSIREIDWKAILFLYSSRTEDIPTEDAKEAGALAWLAKDVGSDDEAERFPAEVAARVAAVIVEDQARLQLIRKFDWGIELFKTLVTDLGTGIDILDPEYHIIYCNRKFRSIVGLLDDWEPRTDDVCWKVYHQHCGRTTPCPGCAVEEVLRTGKPCDRLLTNPVRGKLTFIQVSATPLFTQDKRIYAVVETISDETATITEGMLSARTGEVEWNLDATLSRCSKDLEQLGLSDASFYIYDPVSSLFCRRPPPGSERTPEGVEAYEIPETQPRVQALLKGEPGSATPEHPELLLLKHKGEGDETVVGLLQARRSVSDFPREMESQYCSLVAAAIYHGMRHEVALARAAAAEAIRDLDVKCATAANISEALGTLIDLLTTHFRADMGHLRLCNEAGLLIKTACAGKFQDCIIDVEYSDRDESAAARAYRTRKPVVIRDAAGESIFQQVLRRLLKNGIRESRADEFRNAVKSYAAVPILLRGATLSPEGTPTGTIYLCSTEYGYFSSDKIAAMKDFANRAADLIYRFRLAEEQQKLLGLEAKVWQEAAAAAAHELKNPAFALVTQIHTIQERAENAHRRDDLPQPPEATLAHILREAGPQGVAVRQVLGNMYSCTNRIYNLCERLLYLAKPVELGMETLDVRHLLRDVVKRQIPAGAKWSVDERLDTAVPAVRLDRARFTSAIEELLGNAVGFMPGGGRVCVEVSGPHGRGALPMARFGGDYVLVTISDTGPGVLTCNKEWIFLPFKTTRKGEEGSGLGLAIARKNLGDQGCSIVEDGVPGEGARFRIAVPVPQSPES